MTDYIERDKALSASKIVYIEYIELDGDGYAEGDADNIPVVLKKDIEAIPAADVRPVVRGRWIWDDEAFHCSECFSHAYGNTGEVLSGYYNYCPYCGAKMEAGA